MPRGSNCGARRSLGLSEEDENEEYRDYCADQDSPCDLSVRHIVVFESLESEGERSDGSGGSSQSRDSRQTRERLGPGEKI